MCVCIFKQFIVVILFKETKYFADSTWPRDFASIHVTILLNWQYIICALEDFQFVIRNSNEVSAIIFVFPKSFILFVYAYFIELSLLSKTNNFFRWPSNHQTQLHLYNMRYIMTKRKKIVFILNALSLFLF